MLQVESYDISIEQADATGLTERETAALEGLQLMVPAYRVSIRAIPVGQENLVPAAEAQPEGDGVVTTSKPVGVKLPEGVYPQGVELMLLPTEDVQEAPEGANLVYVSIIDEVGDEDTSRRAPVSSSQAFSFASASVAAARASSGSFAL